MSEEKKPTLPTSEETEKCVQLLDKVLDNSFVLHIQETLELNNSIIADIQQHISAGIKEIELPLAKCK